MSRSDLELKEWVKKVIERNYREDELEDFLEGKVTEQEKERIIEFYRQANKGKGKPLGKEIVVDEIVERLTQQELDFCSNSIAKLKKEVSKAVFGQEEVVHGIILGLLCNGHVLLEGVPGIAKTLVVRAVAKATGCDVKRVQFTVDLLPTDIIGLTTYNPKTGFEIEKGPIFTNFLIADEINRSPPKTQSALIEAMQERQVTLGKESFKLPDPFFVMATMNPLENAGVYPLPEAQVDRFLFKLKVDYPSEEDEAKVMDQNMTFMSFEELGVNSVLSAEEIIKMQDLVKKVYLGENIKRYILKIVRKTRDKNFKFAEYIDYGVSPRSSIAFYIAAKANALANRRDFVLPEDVNSAVHNVLRHRLLLSYKATIHNLTSEEIIDELLKEAKE